MKDKEFVDEVLNNFIKRERSSWQIGSGDDAYYVEQVESYIQKQRKMWLAFSEFAIAEGRKQLAEEIFPKLDELDLESKLGGWLYVQYKEIREKLQKEIVK